MKKTLKVIMILAVIAVALVGCSESNSPSTLENVPSSNSAPAYDPATATGRIFGSIKFEGAPPVMEPLQPGGSRFCVVHARGQTAEDILVTKDSRLRNVIVYVKSGFEGRTYSAPDKPVVLDQQRCLYVPHVFTIMAHQKLIVKNSDDTFHNVHAMVHENAPFNFSQTEKGAENSVTFDHAEMPVRIGCDLHRWMGVFAGVFDHPFHSTTGDTGEYQFSVPPGKYQIAAWHEKLGEQVESVEVSDNAQVQLNFRFRP